jgi:NADPH-dependent 2,4-dienoyl-CoA reductase/sulfur reductase-like enzyme/rhodanese-related sulfurtransferase/two-component sensor histidine kinase
MPKLQHEIEILKKRVVALQNEVDQLLRQRSEYLRVSAHQMKSPLTTISFSIGALLKEYAGRLNWKQLRIIESIKNSSESLQNLIHDILELEKLRIEKVKLENFDFVKICTQAIEELRSKIEEKDITFSVNMPNKILITLAHPIGMQQAVYNLMENSVKYSPRNAEVSVTVGFDEVEGNIICIVRDNGIGIPEEEQERIFEEFYRAPNARRFDKTGTGFGMAIVKRVLDIARGSIQIWSREKEGTKITLTVPLIEARERALTIRQKPRHRKRIVIIGGVSAGPKAASRARRIDPDAEITLFEKGYFLAYSGCTLPYYISGQLRSRRDLATAVTGFHDPSDFFRSVKGINIKNLSEVTRINPKNKTMEYMDLVNNHPSSIPYDALILATGSAPSVPNIEGVDLQNIFEIRNINDAENIKLAIKNDIARDIVILGGGLIGVEIADALTVSGSRVTIVEKGNHILPYLDPEMAALVEHHMEHKGIRIIKNEKAQAFKGKNRVEYVHLAKSRLPASLIILAMGVKPNVVLAKKTGLKLGATGAILVNEFMQTSEPSIYAAGDCTETIHAINETPYYLPLGSIANRQGRVAGANAAGKNLYKFSAVTGTWIIKVFDYHVAKTGFSESEALQLGFEPVSSFVPEYDKEHFIPGAEIINIKMTGHKQSKKLLGVQIVGKGDVAKRIDIAAMVISKKGSIDDLLSVDLGYAPAFSNAMGAIIVAANVLQNKLDGLFEGVAAKTVQNLLESEKDGHTFLDVRLPQTYDEERIPGFDSIPLENLRSRIDEIPRNKGVILVCQTGGRSYQAALILNSLGFKNVKILEGGLRMWPFKISRD